MKTHCDEEYATLEERIDHALGQPAIAEQDFRTLALDIHAFQRRRNDAYARQHRIRVEESKMGNERGKYLYPTGFGFGTDKQIGLNRPRLAQR